VLAPEIDERPLRGELPRACALRLARLKADAVPARPGDAVLAADTVVALGRRILGKPADAGEAAAFLDRLSGRRHRVITAVALRLGDRRWTRAVETAVRFKRLDAHEIAAYVGSGEWRGKAGAYAIQGRAAGFIPWIGGSYTNVVGLPLTEALSVLAAAGVTPAVP
jgi:septum formation protein